MARDGKYGDISIPGIPDDEPIFILRGQDKAASTTIDDYGVNAEDAGATREFVVGLREAFDRFEQWANDNPDKMKTPD